MKGIDLNCDMGEGFGAYRIGPDEELMKYITSANVACGWHAGDPMVMQRTVLLAKKYSVRVGAHPGYPDLLGFGRRKMDLTLEEVRHYVTYQVGALWAFCKVNNVALQHVKPHGALYNRAVEDQEVSRVILEAIKSLDPNLIYVGLAGKRAEALTRLGQELGVRICLEAFPDRNYTPEGTLLNRKYPEAVIKDPEEVADRAVMMARDGSIKAVDGSTLELPAHTLCIHGDNPAGPKTLCLIRERLLREGLRVVPMADLLT